MTHLPASVAMWQYWFYREYTMATGITTPSYEEQAYPRPFSQTRQYGFYSRRAVQGIAE